MSLSPKTDKADKHSRLSSFPFIFSRPTKRSAQAGLDRRISKGAQAGLDF
jgi:hypothetical protein